MSEVEISATFSLNDLLVQYGVAEEQLGEDWKTSAEWAELFGVSVDRMRVILLDVKGKGKLEQRKVRRRSLDDAMRLTTAYRFVRA